MISIQHVKLYILSAYTDFTESIKNNFTSEMNIAMRFHTESLSSLSTNLRKGKSNILLINDHKFSKKDIVHFVEEISVSYHLTKTILYTRSFDKKYLKRILDSGTKGILHKNDTPLPSSSIKIFNAIAAVNNGINCFDPVIRNGILKHAWAKGNDDIILGINGEDEKHSESKTINLAAEKNKNLLENLTIREFEIILQIAQGKKNREIAEALNISVGTTEQHKNNIKTKLKLKSSGEILNFIYKNKKDFGL